ncbi:precorrin-2 dehydrogenase/sirohydrochlorin ferrochelatase family protein [Methanoplanus endosymbiosus]|uniref:precorrin-2 dehydrogenase n=1 Tax=Methanoplanus endosymbiosus TaxID=33865 RepID=A0A9E7THA3_9EURY|nr:bifunctional precorrin-2 dehydrogenase/sirohydrochlorin ferrochelatase [Methanoplanus endosymbiosus]UUX92472.1 bifunctional precorrin-2 dehydrogenase/sirohydrochlorin ferrochelatase [Methanoplanus endosymbiosus]
MIPLIHDFTGKRVTIFGGGKVGFRKAGYFSGESELTIISGSFLPEFKSIQAKLLKRELSGLTDIQTDSNPPDKVPMDKNSVEKKSQNKKYGTEKEKFDQNTEISEIIQNSALVIAATSDKSVNNKIGEICRTEKIPFNNADGEPGDIIIPSIIKGENYTIAVTTGGKSPGISRHIRILLEEKFKNLDGMIEITEETRKRLKETIEDQSERNGIIREILSDKTAWEQLEKDKNSAREYIHGKYLA